MEQLKINFKKEENQKITLNNVINNLFVNQTKESKQNMLDTFNQIISINNEEEKTISIFLNSNIKKSFFAICEKCFDNYILAILKTASNNDLKNILFKTFCNDYKLIRKLKSKFDGLYNYQINEKTQTYNTICKSLILSIFNYYKLQVLQIENENEYQFVICDFESWQNLLKTSYNEYMQKLKTFFENGEATNLTPTKDFIKKLN